MIQVKHQRKTLTKLVKHRVEWTQPIGRTKSVENQRGRTEIRMLSLYTPGRELQADWPTIKRVIAVRRIRIIKGNQSDKVHYYITSLNSKNPEQFQWIIRNHWGIENKLHWVKDVIMREDATSFHNYKAIKMNALFRNFVFTCIKLNNYSSIKYALEILRSNPKKILKIIRT